MATSATAGNNNSHITIGSNSQRDNWKSQTSSTTTSSSTTTTASGHTNGDINN